MNTGIQVGKVTGSTINGGITLDGIFNPSHQQPNAFCTFFSIL
jgi:hypothetical protein